MDGLLGNLDIDSTCFAASPRCFSMFVFDLKFKAKRPWQIGFRGRLGFRVEGMGFTA